MSDLDELERLIISSKIPAAPVSGATALALIAELRALRRYRDRYEWMRRRAVMIDTSDDVAITLTLFKNEGPTGEFLDEQIDAALAQKEG